MLKKNERRSEKMHRFFHCFFIDFSWKIDDKSCKKTRKTQLCTKIEKKLRLERPFLAKNRFFGHF